MAYLGTQVQNYEETYETRTDYFNGNGSNTEFTLTHPVAKTIDIEVLVNNVQQNPHSGSYSVNGTTLTFAAAPSAASNNVYVVYRSFFRTSPILNTSAIITDYIAPLAVTTAKLDTQSVTTAKVANTITLGNVTFSGPGIASNTFTVNTRATSANHATQKQYVDALTIIFGA
jgi:hypothetical protein